MAAIAAVRGYATARRAAPGPSASSCTGIQLAVTALWWRRGGEFPLKSAEASAAAAACRARLKLGGCGARVRAGIELGRAPRSTAVLWQVRRYRNIWGSNSGLSTIHPDPSRPKAHDSLKAHDNLTTPGGWRLDWEEDGRWVEWRMDENGQTDDDRFRVTMEWTRFNRARGRDHTNLWEEEKTSGFNRGSSSWWREQYYEYEYTGANGISSMTAVKEACSALGLVFVEREWGGGGREEGVRARGSERARDHMICEQNICV